MADNTALQMMFQNGMNGLAALQMGGNNAISQQQEQSKLREMQLKNENDSVMNPLNAQFMQGRIAAQQAELPGLGGISQSQVAKGKYDTSTTDSNIATAIAKNGASIGESGMQQMKQDAEKMGQVAGVLGGFDPSMHAQLLPKVLQQYGLSADSPIVQRLLQAPDPSMIVPALTKISDGMAKGTQAYLANTGQQNQAQTFKQAELTKTLDSHEKIAGGNNATALEVARIQAESRIKAADSRSKGAMKNMNMDQKITYLSGIPEDERTPAEAEQLQALAKQRLSERAASAPAVAPTVMNQKTPQQVANDTAAANFPKTPTRLDDMSPENQARIRAQAKAQFDLQPANKSGDSQIADLAKKNGQAYEPAKYEYKVVDGVLHRRLK